MAQRNLTYSIRGIFTDCLPDHHASQYLIAAYQRGYKWESGTAEAAAPVSNQLGGPPVGQVDKLLADLWRAFEAPRRDGIPIDYYLQFLTLKPALMSKGRTALEVIDGQQRLTTLSLFFAVLRQTLGDGAGAGFAFIENSGPSSGSAAGKLEYAVRDHFLEEFVYQGNIHKLLEAPSWEAFLEASFNVTSFDCDQQDIFYLYKAAHKISSFLQDEQRRPKAAAFGLYVADSCRLIANVIEEEISSEDVFSDLNSNRVPLTDTELVKGLLLTRASRSVSSSFQQVQELRASQGRQWDEIARWLQLPGVRVLYGLKTEHALWQLLRLVALRKAAPFPAVRSLVPHRDAAAGPGFALYEFFEYLLSFGAQAPTAEDCFIELQLLSGLLHDWFNTPDIHNQLGALQASKRYEKKGELMERITAEEQLLAGGPRTFLRQEIGKLSCLKSDLAALSYDAGSEKAFDLLLLLNVFPERSKGNDDEKADSYPFDFARFSAEKWSLEHIYPQHPAWAEEQAPVGTRESLLALAAQDSQPADPAIVELLMQETWSEEETQKLQQYLRADNQLLHSLGNLALLTSGDNSSVSNAPFAEKRRRLMQRVRQGSFVAPHTFSVFSKLILSESTSPFDWTKADIRAHATYLDQQLARLVQEFSTPSLTPTA
ncbi:hypothetical protein GCM10011375_32650 [Hymenobacter qilianensis]|uniref:Uncharacterized protein n=2 Tax=Hymenobacter qilianensis TaxID=1385715 RepID=A0ACB5PVA0_9BACT|nr:DUF262 domain-containing protein [Hymenobacter qilianensis]QNP51452.1 DUF262 domain-containing protein [Hymenobacter qilianensis]GGF75037.1 hypothetical protein GCM10011375_32650 [Hymenobacter qilianensis]